jgi:predicted anti-sigma-YlaC factor YlaD
MAGETIDLQRGCSRAREWASLRLDGELSELERLLLRRHLSRCAGCREFTDAVVRATEVVRTTPDEKPARAVEHSWPPARRRKRYGLAAVAAAAAIGATVGVLATTGGERSPAQPQPVTDIVLLPPELRPLPPAPPVEPPGENV